MWAQHGHIQCVHNTHLLGKQRHASAMKIFLHSEIASKVIFLPQIPFFSVLPVCSLHVHMKAIAHANNYSSTLAFHIIFTRAPVNFPWAQAWVYQM